MQKKKRPESSSSETSFDFIEPMDYRSGTFGRATESIEYHIVNPTVTDARNAFRIFDDMRNAESWPISKIIQRELDAERAQKIARDYLLASGFIKFFPPLVAVLLPTDDKFLPRSSYEDVDPDEIKAVQEKIVNARLEQFKDFEKPLGIAGGIVMIPWNHNEGYLVWNRNRVTGVVIDGQHRLKALDAAANSDATYLTCRIPIVLVNLVSLGSHQPAKACRDLFVQINNTPEQVDESRLILMDDRDALATFTQVLVDDSDSDNVPPVLPPELIDWHCDAGKHDIGLSLSGVITLREVIRHALFDRCNLGSIDERMKKRGVSKWIDRVEDWLDVDTLIRERLGEHETLRSTFKRAEECSNIEQDADDEDTDGGFLFSYSASVSRILMERFSDLYRECFHDVYRNLAPYAASIEVATEQGALTNGTLLNRYLRSSSQSRRQMDKSDPLTRSAVQAFRVGLLKVQKDSLLHTVLGQKAVFQCLMSWYLGQVESNKEAISSGTIQFINEFNLMHSGIVTGYGANENFFSMRYRMPKSVSAAKVGDLGREFWRGIVLKQSGDIDWTVGAVKELAGVLADMMLHIQKGDASDFQFSKRQQLVRRHVRIISAHDSTLPDIDALAEAIVSHKEKLLSSMLGKISFAEMH